MIGEEGFPFMCTVHVSCLSSLSANPLLHELALLYRHVSAGEDTVVCYRR